jgi:cysteine desulfurase
MPNIYLDHQSATPLRPEVFQAMEPFLVGDGFGNPSSLHQHGLKVRDALARAREQVAAFLHAESPEEILFTSDGTESANLAIKGVAWASQKRGRHLVASAIEHPALMESLTFLEKQDFESTRVSVNREGRIDPASIADALKKETILTCVHHVNYDVGTVQPITEISEACDHRGVPLYVDAESSAGWMDLDVQQVGCALASFSPHKMGGPKGTGVLYRHRRARLTNLIHGGIQEGGLRAGVENVAGIIGTGVACELAGRSLKQRSEHVGRLQRRLWEGLKAKVPFIKLNGPEPGPDRVCASLNISFEFVEGEGLLLMLDTKGIAVASGTSCVSKALKVSPVLQAIGSDHALGQGSVLFSLSDSNTDAEIDAVLEVVPRTAARLRDLSPMWDEFQRGLIDSVIAPRALSS